MHFSLSKTDASKQPKSQNLHTNCHWKVVIKTFGFLGFNSFLLFFSLNSYNEVKLKKKQDQIGFQTPDVLAVHNFVNSIFQ